MKESTNKEPAVNALALWWGELTTGLKFCYSWLAIMSLAFVVLGIIFPIFGLVVLGIVAVFTTIFVLIYLDENG